MKGPHVMSVIKDEARGVTFEIWAYRKLTYDELVFHAGETVREMGPKKWKKVKRGQRLIVQTVLGCENPDP